MRINARVDDNQKKIVEQIRRLGYSVQHLHQLGKGCPDLLVGAKNHNYLFELKDPAKPPSQRRLTNDEHKWHTQWNGAVYVVETIDDILRILDNN